MKYLSVCSGIEAASVAWHDLGWTPAAFAEVDPGASAVLAHRFGSNMPGEALSTNGVPNLGDMTRFEEWPDYAIDVLVGGTPCQDYSVAGKRLGMAGERGSLTLTYIQIAARYRPDWCVWENVPGVLSSNGGRDFARFLGDLSGQAVAVPAGGWQNAGIIPQGTGDAYGLAYRVLDAQFTRTRRLPRAVPQRRRRVFVVGYSGDWRRAAAVLFDAPSLRGDPPPRREARQAAPGGIGDGTQGRGWMLDLANMGSGGNVGIRDAGDAAITLDTNGNIGCAMPMANDVAPTIITAQGVALRGREGGATAELTGPASPALRCAGGGGDKAHVLIASTGDVAHSLRGEGFDASEDGTGRGTPLVPVAIQERAVCENPDAGPDGAGFRQDGAAYTLEARTVPQAVAFAENQRGEVRTSEIAMQLTCGGGKPGEGYPAVMTPWAVRRLTPVECERLQGFPDDWTAVPGSRGKPAADGSRYKQLGNSMATNCMEWIGERIALVASLIEEKPQ